VTGQAYLPGGAPARAPGARVQVGLVASGNPDHPLDRLRSLPAEALALLPRLDGVTYVSLTPERPTPLATTAALIAGLDVVISVDTAAAHLAGAMGAPLWLLLPHAADWRWGDPDHTRSRWYDSARLYRQPAPGDWETVLLRVGVALARRLGLPPRSLRDVEAEFAADRLDQAEAALWSALANGADDADGLQMLGAIRLRQGDEAGAVRLSRAALARRPSADAGNNLGVALRRLGRTAEAREAFERVCRLFPGHAGARYNLANLLGDVREPGGLEQAEALYREAIRLAPGHGPAHYNLANALRDLGRLDEALDTYRQALALDPGNAAEIRNSLGMCLLLAGRYAEGWREYEARRQTGRLPDRALAQPEWDGGPSAGRTVLLYAEQGFGDTLQFVRSLPLAARSGAGLVLEVQPGLVALCRSLPGVAEGRVAVIGQGDPLPPIDAQLPLLSLPRVLGAERPEQAPQALPYLSADPARALEWSRRLAGLNGVRIGLVWGGNPRHANDARRSLPLSAFAGLPAGPGFSYVSLQLGPAAAELAASLMRGAVTDLAPHLRDFSDTAAAVAELDLVICCDTAVAHLAGALGRPVWLLLPHAPDWRWGLGRDTTPWYPTMRLFRQPAPGDWTTPLRQIAEEMRRFVPPGVFQAALAAHQAGRSDEAAAGYRSLLARQPDHAEALRHLGLLALAGHRLDEAERQLRRALATDPEQATAWSNLGIVLKRLGRAEGAVAAYRAALELRPDYLEARYNLGNVLRDAGRTDEAAACFRAVAALQPGHLNAWNNLGLVLQNAERFAEAETALGRATTLDPDFPDAVANLGLLHHAAKRYDAALAAIGPAARRWPAHPLVRRTQALILKALDRIADAETVCRAAIELEPGNAEGFNLLGSILSAQNRLDEAAAALHQALVLAPDYAEASWMLGFVELLRGALRPGWRHFEARWRLGILAPLRRRMTRPEWDGRALNGETVLVFAEQGLGDSFHFARYLPLAARRGARVIVEAQAAVLPLLARLPGVAATVVQGQPLPDHDLQVALLSLPRLFDTTLETVPAEPYLSAEPARRERWRQRLAGLSGRRVGLVWAGNPEHGNDRNRSLRFDQLAPLLALPGLSLVSLQLGPAAAPLDPAAALDLGREIGDYDDTAAILEQLDLLISVDTSAAHCAGALGRPVWTLLPFAPDWRWLLGRADTPWYPTMRLFRQPAPGLWPPVIEQVAQGLRQLTRS
jgi:Flp pilus assembly protein TadD/ADP-heptose:LPS heptosyltransferase